MKTILFATGNKSKSQRFSKGLLEHDIEVISLKDVTVKLENEENGKNPVENALIKAREAYLKTNMVTIGMDDSLYFENVPDDKQPGLYVRRVNGKELTDEEMIEHYTGLVNEYGKDGKLLAKWVYGLALIDKEGEEHTYTWEKGGFCLTNQVSKVFNEGYPLNSISKYMNSDKFFSEMTVEEKEANKFSEDDVIEFISKWVNVL